MQTFKQFLTESSKSFSNWVKPDKKALELEYKVEYEIKSLKDITDDAWPTYSDFESSVKKAKVVTVTPSMDKKISYRSRTKSKDQLLNLIRGYASYPEFRNEKTIDELYAGFEENRKMKMPLLLKFPDGSMRVMGGNTRMDVAFQLGINPKVLMIEVPDVDQK